MLFTGCLCCGQDPTPDKVVVVMLFTAACAVADILLLIMGGTGIVGALFGQSRLRPPPPH